MFADLLLNQQCEKVMLVGDSEGDFGYNRVESKTKINDAMCKTNFQYFFIS